MEWYFKNRPAPYKLDAVKSYKELLSCTKFDHIYRIFNVLKIKPFCRMSRYN